LRTDNDKLSENRKLQLSFDETNQQQYDQTEVNLAGVRNLEKYFEW